MLPSESCTKVWMVKIYEGHFVNWSAMELLIMVFTCASIIFLQMGLMVTALIFHDLSTVNLIVV